MIIKASSIWETQRHCIIVDMGGDARTGQVEQHHTSKWSAFGPCLKISRTRKYGSMDPIFAHKVGVP